MDDENAFNIPLVIKAELVQKIHGMAQLIGMSEQIADSAQAAVFKELFQRYDQGDDPKYDKDLATIDRAPWSREDSIDMMLADFADRGWAMSAWDFLEPTDDCGGLWTIEIGRPIEGTEETTVIKEYGYSRELALGAAWVRMRDIEMEKAS